MTTTALTVSPAGIEPHKREILAHHVAEIRRLGRLMIADAIKIGEHLHACKGIVGHGNWTPWVKEEFGWSEQAALNFIRVYEMAKTKSKNFVDLDLPLSAMYLLAAPSTPPGAVDEVIDRAERREVVKFNDVRKTIERHKGKANGKFAALQTHVEKLDPQPTPKKLKATDPIAEPKVIVEPAAVDTDPDDEQAAEFDFERLKKQVAELAPRLKQAAADFTPAQAAEIDELLKPIFDAYDDGLRDLVYDFEKQPRLIKKAKAAQKNSEKFLSAARKREQHDGMDDDRAEAKREARENGETWSEVEDDWEADWLADNWHEQREQEFLEGFRDEWKRDHGRDFPYSDFAPKAGGAS